MAAVNLFFPPMPYPEKISAGWKHTAFVTDDGSVYTFGLGSEGQLGTGDLEDRALPQKIDFPMGAGRVVGVSCGSTHTVFLTDEGNIYACGDNHCGQLGTGDTQSRLIPTKIYFPVDDNYIVQVSTSIFNTAFVTRKGNVYLCGEKPSGKTYLTPKKFDFPEGMIRQVSCGEYHIVFLTVYGEVFASIEPLDENRKVLYPKRSPELLVRIHFPPFTGPIQQVESGIHHSLFLTEAGRVYTYEFGNNEGHIMPDLIDDFPIDSGPIKQISAGGNTNAFLSELGKVYMSGSGRYGQLGTGSREDRLSPQEVYFSSKVSFVRQVSCGSYHTIFLSVSAEGTSEEIYTCGLNEYGQVGNGEYGTDVPLPIRVSFSLF
jgi:E3 ubiquitin-protein ligase HERC4